ncbi:hypothetical protein LXN10_11620 [Arcobacter sp. KX21116]|uniref:hypothetical protein n=1 Tax=Arcobacter iocasae TaxID=2906515 RepID=UPI0035D41D14
MQNTIKINQSDFKKVAKKLRTEITPLLTNPIKHADSLELLAKITNYGTYYNYNNYIKSIPIENKNESEIGLNTDSFTENFRIQSVSDSFNMGDLLIEKFEYLYLSDLLDEVNTIKSEYENIFTVDIKSSYDQASSIRPGLYVFQYPLVLDNNFNKEQIKVLLSKKTYEYFLGDYDFYVEELSQPKHYGVRQNKTKSDSNLDLEIDNLGFEDLNVWLIELDSNTITHFLPKKLEKDWILHQDSIDKVYKRIKNEFNTEKAKRFVMFTCIKDNS